MLLDVPDCCVTLQEKWHEDFDNHGKPIASWIGYKQRRALKKKKADRQSCYAQNDALLNTGIGVCQGTIKNRQKNCGMMSTEKTHNVFMQLGEYQIVALAI